MKSKTLRTRTYKQKQAQQLLGELAETERDFIEAAEKHWDQLQDKDHFQEQLLQITHTLRRAKTILHVIGKVPKSIH